MKVKSLSCVRLLETTWTTAYQAPSGVTLPSPNKKLKEYKVMFFCPCLKVLSEQKLCPPSFIIPNALLGLADTFSIVYSPCSCWIEKSVCAALSHVRLFATPRALARQAPLPMEFSRQEYWNGCHFLLQGHFPTEGWTYVFCQLSSAQSLSCVLLLADSLPLATPRKPSE